MTVTSVHRPRRPSTDLTRLPWTGGRRPCGLLDARATLHARELRDRPDWDSKMAGRLQGTRPRSSDPEQRPGSFVPPLDCADVAGHRMPLVSPGRTVRCADICRIPRRRSRLGCWRYRPSETRLARSCFPFTGSLPACPRAVERALQVGWGQACSYTSKRHIAAILPPISSADPRPVFLLATTVASSSQ
jgi:hypothetical protein